MKEQTNVKYVEEVQLLESCAAAPLHWQCARQATTFKLQFRQHRKGAIASPILWQGAYAFSICCSGNVITNNDVVATMMHIMIGRAK